MGACHHPKQRHMWAAHVLLGIILRIGMCEKKDVKCHRNRCREDTEPQTQAGTSTFIALSKMELERFKVTINQKGFESS